MVPLEQDAKGHWQTTLPSALFFGFEDTEVDCGRRAIARYTAGEPGRLMRAMKSVLGTRTMADTTLVLGRPLTFDEIIGFFITRLRNAAQDWLGPEASTLDAVVMGRPVYFNDNDPSLDREAENHLASIAHIAGFKHVSFQFEPIAAALDYESQIDQEELALIVDIGGGTSDFTLIRLSPERHLTPDRGDDLLATHGIHLGGTDFDRNLSLGGVMAAFGLGLPMRERPTMDMPSHYYHDLATWHRIHLLYDKRTISELTQLKRDVSDKAVLSRLITLLQLRKGHRLGEMVEAAKIALSTNSETPVPLDTLFENASENSPAPRILNQHQLHRAISADLDRIFAALTEALRMAGLSFEDVDTVFTTGGSTAIPLVNQYINQLLPQAKQVAGDLYTSVGSGLVNEASVRYR